MWISTFFTFVPYFSSEDYTLLYEGGNGGALSAHGGIASPRIPPQFHRLFFGRMLRPQNPLWGDCIPPHPPPIRPLLLSFVYAIVVWPTCILRFATATRMSVYIIVCYAIV